MLALTLHQPYASCIALGYKKVETRSWGTKQRGLIAIHAALAWGPVQRDHYRMVVAGLELELPEPMPLGVVVAVAELVDCFRMGGDLERWERLAPEFSDEEALGEWVPGHYALVLNPESIRPLVEPYPLKGRQGRPWLLLPHDVDAIEDRMGEALAAPEMPW